LAVKAARYLNTLLGGLSDLGAWHRMSDSDPFPAYQPPPKPIPIKERVIDYLLMLSAKGWPVRSDGEDYVLPQDDGDSTVSTLLSWCPANLK
jgi:hypothetical protein